jgi:hypothetical protein
MKDRIAPIPAASVAEKTPPYIPPMVMKMMHLKYSNYLNYYY